MSYGIEIRNTADRIILDNSPYHTLEVINSGFFPNGTNLANADGKKGLKLFVAPRAIGEGVYFSSPSNYIVVCPSGLDYVYLKSVKGSVAPTDYGLAIYDNVGELNLVFSDSKRFAIFRKAAVLNLIPTNTIQTVSGIAATTVGRKKYFNIDALYAVASTNVHSWGNSYAFNATETSISALCYDAQTTGNSWSRTTTLNIIEV
jgi:hypothetical protein